MAEKKVWRKEVQVQGIANFMKANDYDGYREYGN